MSGVQYMITGGIIILLATASFVMVEWILGHKKKQIKEQTYQIYD